jgi:sugar (pentulose or hexulose) kinase
VLLGIDVGTTGAKSILLDEGGRIVCSSYKKYGRSCTENGHVEQDAEDWWKALSYTVRECIKDLKSKDEVKAISLSTQGGSMVPVDADGDPLAHAVTWMDTRGAEQHNSLLKLNGEDFYYLRSGWRLSNSFNLVQIAWLRDNVPEVFQRAAKFLSTIDFINKRLTGEFRVDPTSAGMTQLFNIIEQKWDERIIALAGLSRERLPEIINSGEVVGTLSSNAALELGLPKTVRVVSGGHDQYCAALGAGAIDAGDVLLSTGTSWVILAVTDHPVLNTEFYPAPGRHVVGGRWGVISYTPTGGAAFQWMKDTIGACRLNADGSVHPETFAEIDEKVSRKKPGASGIFFHPYFAGTACPTWSLRSRASIVGLTLSHDRYDIFRAVMEGVTYEIKWMLDVLEGTGLSGKRLVVIGGAAKSEVWLEIISDVTGLDVEVPDYRDAACIGAAILAGKGSGAFTSINEGYRVCKRKVEAVHSNAAHRKTYSDSYRLYREWFHNLRQLYERDLEAGGFEA